MLYLPENQETIMAQLSFLNTDKASHHDSSTLYADVAHFKGLGNSINDLRLNDELCDITLMVGNKSIKAHKVILAASSPYFRAMFTGK